MIKSKDFDLDCLASRSLKGPYKTLATFKEFEHALTNRAAQAKVERKSAKFQNKMQEILADEQGYKRRRWFRNIRDKATSGFTFIIWAAVAVGLVGAGLVVLWMKFIAP
jgi:hypothetical protein